MVKIELKKAVDKNYYQIQEIIRVNQAGEQGAKVIYQGQLRALSNDAQTTQVIQHMYEQEIKHLQYFNEELVKRKVRPTIMSPIWNVGGYLLGYISAKLGKSFAMSCTSAVEEVIEKHYQTQMEYLHNQDQDLYDKIKIFREEEIEHKNIGESYTDRTSYCKYVLFKSFVKACTYLAINISKKF